MAWLPISGVVPQSTRNGNQANGMVLKFYEPGTVTPLAVSTDATGGTTTTQFLLDTEGYTTLSGNKEIPHVNQSYKQVLYLNQTDADNDDTGSAVYVIDDITLPGLSGDVIQYASLADAKSSAIGAVGDIIETAEFGAGTGAGGAKYQIVNSNPGSLGTVNHAKTDGSGLWLKYLFDGEISVTQAGGLPGIDVSIITQSILDWLPDINASYPTAVSGVSSNSNIVTFPAISETDAYLFSAQVNVPSDKAVTIDCGGAWGSLMQSTSTSYIFSVKGTPTGAFRNVAFIGASFFKGGVSIEANVRGRTAFENCSFIETPDYAIKGLGVSIVGGVISECKFSSCAGSVSFDFIDCDQWVMRECASVRGSEVDVLLNTTGWKLEFNDFETRANAGASKPWVQTKVGDTWLVENRFGDESIAGFAPPAVAVRIGPNTPDGTPLPDVVLHGNTFKGTNGTPSATEANAAIEITRPPIRVKVIDSKFTENSDYFSSFIEETYIAAIGNDAQKAYSNRERGNFFPQTFTVPKFSNGGLSFDIEEFGSSTEGRRQNLLRQTADLTQSLWLETNCTPSLTAVDPSGNNNSATVLSKSGAGNATTRTQVIGLPSDAEKVTFSCSLKIGSVDGVDRARMYIVNTTDNITFASTKVINLTGEWKDYHVTIPIQDASKSYFAYIAIGANTAADQANTIGSIDIFEPALYEGDPQPQRYPNISNGGQQHDELPWQGLMMGKAYWSYGSFAPISGRYEVGDIHWHTAPSASGHIGWVCTTAGSPGTWKTFGVISA